MPARRTPPKAAKASQRDFAQEKEQAAAHVRLKHAGFFSGVAARRRAATSQIEHELAASIVEAAE